MIPWSPITPLRRPWFAGRAIHSFGVRLVMLSGLLPAAPGTAPAAAPVVPEVRMPVSPILPPLEPPDSRQPSYPDFASPGEKLEDIKKAAALTEEERAILSTLPEQSTGRLIEILTIYERMGNLAMIQEVGAEVLKRLPNHPQALRLTQALSDETEVRRPGYLEQTAANLLAGRRTEDPEAVDVQARSLLAQRQSSEAVLILEKLRELNFPDQPFPYLETLGFCYLDLKRWDDAQQAFQRIVEDASSPEESRSRATAQLESIKLEKRIAALRQDVLENPEKGLEISERLLTEVPEHPSVIEFRVDCLHYAGRHAEAGQFIERLRSAWKSALPFPYERLSAHTSMYLKQWDHAQAAFQSIAANPVFDDDARADAQRGVASSAIARKGEAAVAAADRGEADLAHTLLSELGAEHSAHLEVTGYRAAVLARLGARDEALRLLLDRKNDPAFRGKPFVLQDTLGDVHIQRKEFQTARAAYQEILADKTYDWDLRRHAMDGLRQVRKSEIQEDAFQALQNRRPSKARAALAELRAEFGGERNDIAILEAEIKLAEMKVSSAKKDLESLDAATPPGKLFPARSSLGAAQLRTGEWQKALDTYSDLLDRAPAFTPYEQMSARWERRLAVPLTKPTLTTNSAFRLDEDGSVLRLETDYASAWWGGWRLGGFAHLDLIYLDDAAAATTLDEVDERYEGGVRLWRKLGPRLAAEIMAGASNSEPIYGLRFGDFLNPGLIWSLSFLGNVRSTDSVRIEAVDARENRVEFQFGGPLPGPWNLDVHAYGNWMHLGGAEDIGHGYGATAVLEYVWQTETEKRPEITLGLYNEMQRFSYVSDALAEADLFDGDTQRHGLQLALRKNIRNQLRLEGVAGSYYAFDEHTLEFMAGLTVQYYLSDDALLFAELRYNSDSRSAGGNSGALEANVGASISF